MENKSKGREGQSKRAREGERKSEREEEVGKGIRDMEESRAEHSYKFIGRIEGRLHPDKGGLRECCKGSPKLRMNVARLWAWSTIDGTRAPN